MKPVSRITVVALLALAAGCGPSAKEKKLVADMTELQNKSAALETQVNDLTKQNSSLKSDLDQAQSQVASMQAEKQKLSEKSDNYDALVQKLSGEVESGNLQIQQFKNMLSVDVAEKLFFDSGSATLKASGGEVLMKVGEAMKQYPDKVIRVVGHTDNVPISTKSHFASNWELSTMRATNVVRFLQDKCGIEPDRLIASGRGEFQPVAENTTPEGRQKNRRIEIMLIDKTVVDSMSERPGASKE